MSTRTSINHNASRLLSCALLSIIALSTTACKDEPTKAWALETFPKHKDTLTKVEGQLTPLFKTLDLKPFSKMDKDNLKAQQDAQTARLKTFDEAALKVLQSHPDIIGWEITYSFPDVEKPVIPYGFDKLSTYVPSYKGGVTWRAGKRDAKGADKYPLGWGMYQIRGKASKKSLGMDVAQYFKGLEILSTLSHNDAVLKLRLFFVDPALHKEAS